jgi:adenylate cyclase
MQVLEERDMSTGVEMRRMRETARDVLVPAAIRDARETELPVRLERAVWLRAGVANIGGALPLVVLGGEYVRRFTPKYADLPLFWTGVLITVLLFLPMWTTLRLQSRRLLRRSTAWIAEGRRPTPDEQLLAASLPRRVGAFPAPWWAAACVLAVAVIYRLGVAPTLSELIVGVVGIVLGGVVSCGLCYLLAEDALRPLFRIVLAETAPPRRPVGVRTRLVAYWAVGSGGYLFGIALILLNFKPDIARPIAIVCCGLGAVIGFVMTNLSAASITRPLDRLREGIRRVESGDLEATVDVDDPGDVGSLQSGFNRMVAGLRERDRLHELFGRHVGAEVARRALETNAGLGGTELSVSVLFVDVIGSSSLAFERPPDAVVAILNSFFAAVVRTVGADGGFVNQFQGDGALCLFGAPDELPDHAARALRAATSLRAEIGGIAARYPGFDAAIGVSSGRVVAGNVGAEDRHDYTVIGDPVNEASRLCDEAKLQACRVLVSHATVAAAAADDDGWSLYGELNLRGRPRPTVAFEPG